MTITDIAYFNTKCIIVKIIMIIIIIIYKGETGEDFSPSPWLDLAQRKPTPFLRELFRHPSPRDFLATVAPRHLNVLTGGKPTCDGPYRAKTQGFPLGSHGFGARW